MSDKKCPICSTDWTVTPKPTTGFWTHCKPCNKKKETILEEIKNKPKSCPVNPSKYIGAKYALDSYGNYDHYGEGLTAAEWDDTIYSADQKYTDFKLWRGL